MLIWYAVLVYLTVPCELTAVPKDVLNFLFLIFSALLLSHRPYLKLLSMLVMFPDYHFSFWSVLCCRTLASQLCRSCFFFSWLFVIAFDSLWRDLANKEGLSAWMLSTKVFPDWILQEQTEKSLGNIPIKSSYKRKHTHKQTCLKPKFFSDCISQSKWKWA